jgi:hypothetical protein
MLTVTFADQLAHVRTLAKQLGIAWGWCAYFVAYVSERRIGTPEIRTWADLARVLHELGHTQTDSEIDHSSDAIANDWIHGGTYRVNLDGEQRSWRWAREHALEWNAEMEAEKLRCLATYRHRAKGKIDNPIWRELTSIDGRLTVGYAHIVQQRREMLERVALVAEWEQDIARQRAASPMRKFEQLIKEMQR